MRGSVISTFSNREEFQAAMSADGSTGFVFTGSGRCRGRTTKIGLDRLRLFSVEDNFPSIAFHTGSAGDDFGRFVDRVQWFPRVLPQVDADHERGHNAEDNMSRVTSIMTALGLVRSRGSSRKVCNGCSATGGRLCRLAVLERGGMPLYAMEARPA
jgi:hypothetical protein